MSEFIRLVKEDQIDLGTIITREYPLSEAPAAFQKLTSGEEGIIGAVLKYPTADGREPSRGTKFILSPSRWNVAASKGRLKVGIIGLGNIARWVHLPNVVQHPKLKLKGVCTTKGYSSKHLGTRFGAEYCTTDYKEIIQDPDIDLIIISTRHGTHASMAMEALGAGKHVFIEKPMAMKKEECTAILKLVRDTGLGFMVNFNRRFSPLYQSAKKATTGRGPMLISVRMNSPDMTGASWAMDPVEGGGAILSEGCHFFDLMAWFSDSPPVSLFARSLVSPQDPVTSLNNIACCVSFENGSTGNLIYETIGHRGLGSERVEISAAGSTAIVEDMRKLWMWAGKSAEASKVTKWKAEKGYYHALGDFVEKLLAGRSFEDEALAGARATVCALNVLKCLETELPVRIDLS